MYVCERARAAGVRPGMTLAHARSLCVGRKVHDQPATPDEDAAALRRLARRMLRYAPVVAPDDPDGLLLDIAGCERIFGGERAHVLRIVEALRRWGLAPRLVVAPTFACAWALARYGEESIAWIADAAVEESLAPLPVYALRVSARTLDAMADVDIERIGHLLALPRDELAARFGAELLLRLDQATGAAAESIQSIQIARRFEAAHAFEGPVRRIEIIEATARELLTRLLNQLDAVHRGILELVIELRRVDVEPQTIAARLTYPSRDPAHLWKLLGPKLERVHLGFGVIDIALRAVRTERIKNEQAAFLREVAPNTDHQPAALGELVDRLIDRLGGGAVTRVQPAQSYVPEKAFVHAAVRETTPSAARRRLIEEAVNPAHRPSQLFETPEPIRVMSLVPDGPPVWLNWRGRESKIIVYIGPERIVSPWWSGAAAAARDYYEVEDADGRQLWIFREGDSGSWYVHGQWM